MRFYPKDADGLSVPSTAEGATNLEFEIEGLEKAERNLLPLINNLLENREMALEDGSLLIHPDRYDSLRRAGMSDAELAAPGREHAALPVVLRVYLRAARCHQSLQSLRRARRWTAGW